MCLCVLSMLCMFKKSNNNYQTIFITIAIKRKLCKKNLLWEKNECGEWCGDEGKQQQKKINQTDLKWWQQLEQRIVVISTNEVVFIIGMVTIYTALANIIDKMNMRWHNFHILNFSRWTVFVDARHWPPFLITLYACLCTFLLFVFFFCCYFVSFVVVVVSL